MEKEQITLTSLQRMVDEWIMGTGKGYFSELTNTAILAEEVGEVSRLMARIYGQQKFKPTEKKADLADELADVLWIIACLANQTGVDLQDAITKNLQKKNERDSKRYL
jgi:NTP pyrophosphatase (non-canonical NTP hydrolase)